MYKVIVYEYTESGFPSYVGQVATMTEHEALRYAAESRQDKTKREIWHGTIKIATFDNGVKVS